MSSLVADATDLDRHALLTAMRGEERLLIELCQALARQRAGVAADDPAAVEAATHQVSRTVLTLDQARRRREQLTQLLGGGELLPLDQLELRIGTIAGLVDLRRSLREAATAAVRDLALNQSILRGAIRAGDSYLQSLFASVAGAPSSYTRAAKRTPAPAVSGVVVNRRA